VTISAVPQDVEHCIAAGFWHIVWLDELALAVPARGVANH
jgi:hypothetical protein